MIRSDDPIRWSDPGFVDDAENIQKLKKKYKVKSFYKP